MKQPHNGTAILDFVYYEEQAEKMSTSHLVYAIRDCHNAIENAIPESSFPCKAEGFYYDLCSVYDNELKRRGV